MKKLLPAAALLILGFTTAAHAAEDRFPRWYAGLNGSLSYMADADLEGSGAISTLKFSSPGWGIGANIGYIPAIFADSWIDGMRFEGELYYRRNNTDTISNSGLTGKAKGSMSSLALMANAIYDYNNDTGWLPYFGAGIGMAQVKSDMKSFVVNTSGSANVFAYQFLVGIGYAPESMPTTLWNLGYRYFATAKPEFSGVPTKVKSDYSSHNVELGVKVRF